MNFNQLDYFLIGIFLCGVCYIIIKNLFSKQSTDNYFRAGGNIHWMLIGCSLIAADMSLSYVVGCSGMGFHKGIAIGSYEWTAAIAMIFVALYILPKFMALGVLTLPEYLELRYSSHLRLMVSILIICAHIVSGLATSFFSTAVLIEELFHLDPSSLQGLIWGSGLLTCAIILSGGLSAMVRTNAVIVVLLLVGGLVLVFFCLLKVGGFNNFMADADNRMDAVLPADDPMLPWTQVFLGSLWILHLYYWAFNQFIVQTMLASSSLSGAQKGMLFAVTIKLFIPFLFFIPGIVGYELYQGEVSDPDRIFPIILREIIPSGIKGFILIAFIGTVIGATNAMLNACSTIFSHDIYKRFIQKDASGSRMILVSRISVVVFVMLACFLAPNLQNFQHVFQYSQYIAVAISPILAAIFLFGIYSKRTPPIAAIASFLIAVPAYILLVKYGLRIASFFAQVELFDATFLAEFFGSLSTLQFAGINFILTCSILLIIRFIKPLKNPQNLLGKRDIRFERNLVVVIWSIFLFTMVAAIYIIFL